MKSMHKLLGIGMLLTLLLLASTTTTTTALAQRPRNMNDPATPSAAPPSQPTPPPAPPTVKAKYEGGIFGYRKKISGALSFDDPNKRLLFRDKDQREIFSLPYDSIVSAFADTQSRRPTAASIIGGASIYTLPALLIRKKYRYLTLQYNDPDTNASGITSFKLENKQILESVLNSLANKAGLTQRGEIFVRRKDSMTGKQSSPE